MTSISTILSKNISSANFTYVCDSFYYGKMYLGETQKLILVSFGIIVMVLNVLGNTAVIYGLVSTNQLRNISLKLILYLALVDLSVGLVAQPLFLLLLTNFSTYDNIICALDKSVMVLSVFLQHLCAYIVAVMGFDRYFRVKYLNRYYVIIKQWKVCVMLIAALLLSFLQALIHFIGAVLSVFAGAGVFSFLLDATVLITVSVVYTSTIRIVRMHRKDSANKDTLRTVDNTVTSVAAKIILGVTICYGPYLVFILISSPFGHDRRQWVNFVKYITYELTFANSFANAFIFLSLNRKSWGKIVYFVRSVMMMVKRQDGGRGSVSTSVLKCSLSTVPMQGVCKDGSTANLVALSLISRHLILNGMRKQEKDPGKSEGGQEQ